MRRNLLYIILALFCMAGCKKQPNSYTSAKMNGNWIALGRAIVTASGYSPAPPDAFIQLSITVLNGSNIVANHDTMVFKSTDPTSHVLTFSNNKHHSIYPVNYEYIYYNPETNGLSLSVQDNGSSGGMMMNVSTSDYKHNPLLKSYIADIIGTKVMSGLDYDTLYSSKDSTYSVGLTIRFSAINDSTFFFDNAPLNFYDSTLHYKSTDDSAKTITFQNFHSTRYELSTLIYNYETKHLVFEQRYYDGFESRYVVLQ